MFGKIFLVFTVVVSVLLAGVSVVAFFAVPSMHPAMAELNDYTFTAKSGEKVTWDVTRRLGDGGSVKTGATAFDAVLAARGDAKQTLQTQLNEISQEQAEVDAQLQLLTTQQQQDVDAMTRRTAELETVAEQYRKQVVDKSGEYQNLSVAARIVRDEIGSRRQDVIRLQEELAELRTHLFELQQLRRTLVDRLLRIQLDNNNLEIRDRQISLQVGQ